MDGQQTYEPSVVNEMAGPSTATANRQSAIKKKDSVRRSGSRRSRAVSVSSLFEPGENKNSVFYTPVPTRSNPTELLINRFNAWRRILKDFIAYFKEVQAQYEARARGVVKITATLNQAAHPSDFLSRGGILEANSVLRDFHKEAATNTENAARLETVIQTLSRLRIDLAGKTKEIKGLSGDFKNDIEKQRETTKKEVLKLQEILNATKTDEGSAKDKDPYLTKLSVEHQIRRYLHEENYLHKAYLNLEASGRELERLVVAEIQKAYTVYVTILRNDGQQLLDIADRLTATTLSLPGDSEWSDFVEREPSMVSPTTPLRTFDQIEYPGCHDPSLVEVYSGPLERKSKYLKSFTPGWYVLSSTHLHEFKSHDRAHDQTPEMTLRLADSKLGKTSDPHAKDHKFVLKGRQLGGIHRDHSWVFRTESHAKMMEWYDAIKNLTAPAPERDEYISGTIRRRRATENPTQALEGDDSSDLDVDEADEVPYSAQMSVADEREPTPTRPEGGRFPSYIQLGGDARQGSVSDDEQYEPYFDEPRDYEQQAYLSQQAQIEKEPTAKQHMAYVDQQHYAPQKTVDNQTYPQQQGGDQTYAYLAPATAPRNIYNEPYEDQRDIHPAERNVQPVQQPGEQTYNTGDQAYAFIAPATTHKATYDDHRAEIPPNHTADQTQYPGAQTYNSNTTADNPYNTNTGDTTTYGFIAPRTNPSDLYTTDPNSPPQLPPKEPLQEDIPASLDCPLEPIQIRDNAAHHYPSPPLRQNTIASHHAILSDLTPSPSFYEPGLAADDDDDDLYSAPGYEAIGGGVRGEDGVPRSALAVPGTGEGRTLRAEPSLTTISDLKVPGQYPERN